MEKQELNLLLEVFKQIRNNQLRWDEEPFMLTNDNRHIYLTSLDDTISGCKIDQYIQASQAVCVSFYFETFEEKIRVVFY